MSDAIPYETIVERVKDDIDYIAGSAYARGYNTAKSEIALSGEYERAYMRGKKDALHWIPCSERLPEEDGRYLVTLENGHEKILNYATTQTIRYPQGFYYITEDGFAWRQTQNLVTAWMPLPEPYGGEEE